MSNWLSVKDVALLGVIPVASLFTWSVPEPYQERIAFRIARIRHRLGGERAVIARRIESIGGKQGFGAAPESIADAYFANLYLINLFNLRNLGPGGWNPPTELEGKQHIDAALAKNRGAILWRGDFTFVTSSAYLAFRRAGYGAHVLTRHDHGYTKTEFARRFLNRVDWRARSGFVREFLVIGPDDRIGHRKPLDVLSERLGANLLVFIRAYDAGARTAMIPVRDGTARIATGPLALAQRTGAALLPTWTVRQPGGVFKTTVEAPLDLHDGDPAVAIERSLARYAALHERYVSAYPDQFHWHRAYAREA